MERAKLEAMRDKMVEDMEKRGINPKVRHSTYGQPVSFRCSPKISVTRTSNAALKCTKQTRKNGHASCYMKTDGRI